MISSIDHCFNNQTGKIIFISTEALLSNDAKAVMLHINAGHRKVQIYTIVNKTFLAVLGTSRKRTFD